MLGLMYDHPDLVFIRSHPKSDIPKCGHLKFLSMYTGSDTIEIAVSYGNLEVVKHLILDTTNPSYISLAAGNGHAQVVEYLESL